MMKPAAFLFDLDGTLVDTEAAWAKAIVDLVVMHGGRTTLGEILPAVVGRNWLDIDAALHEKFPVLGDTTPMQDAIELRKYYNKHAGNPRAMPDRIFSCSLNNRSTVLCKRRCVSFSCICNS